MAYDTTILADSPVRYWKLRETTGIVATEAVGAANGTYTPGSPSWTGGTLNQTGPNGFGAPVFNGTTGYVATGNVPISGSHVTFECFVNIAGTGTADQVIFSKADSGPIRFEIITGGTFGGVNMGLDITIGDGGGGQAQYITGAVFTAANWYHCVVVYDGTLGDDDKVKIYVNGVQVATTRVSIIPGTTLPIITTTVSAIGARLLGGANAFFHDKLADVAVYAVSLTAAQARAHFLASGLANTYTAVVPVGGTKVDLTFSASVTGITSDQFMVTANGIVMKLDAITGSGTAWSLPLNYKSGWIPSGQTVRVSYVGGATNPTNALVAATNNSIRTQAQQRYVERAFGIFLHLSSSSYGTSGAVTLPFIQAIDMPGYDIDQWFTSVVVPSGARYAVLTAKHDGGYCLWPTASGSWNISQTAFGVAHPGADVVRDFTRACRKYNIGVGIYINFYDPWWTTTHGLPYSNAGYIPYMTQQITELFSNYGKIDMFWIDSLGYSVSYSNFPWANVVALRDSLQPTCALVNNGHESGLGTETGLSHSDICVYEGSGAPDTAPPSTPTETTPGEFCEDSRLDNEWLWIAGHANDSYKDPYGLAAKLRNLNVCRVGYLLNIPVATSGAMPASSGTFATILGTIVGKQGGPVYPLLSNVRYATDRGDGQPGVWGGGINSSVILGVL